MGLITVVGTVTALGQSELNRHLTIYSYIEITDADGRPIIVEGVAVGNDVAPALALGTQGELFFDKIFVYGRRFKCDLWGLKTGDGRVAFERNSLRTIVTWSHCARGLMLSPVLGVGVPMFVIGLGQLMLWFGSTGERRRVFYGDELTAATLRQQEAIRL